MTRIRQESIIMYNKVKQKNNIGIFEKIAQKQCNILKANSAKIIMIQAWKRIKKTDVPLLNMY